MIQPPTPPLTPKERLMPSIIATYVAELVPLQRDSHDRRAWQGVDFRGDVAKR
jgi:hypothetical protein